MDRTEKNFRRIASILDDTRDALVAGNFAALAGLNAKLLRLTATFDGSRAAPPALCRASEVATLKSKAERNQRLLAASIRGFKQAAGRHREVRSALFSCRAYDKNGCAVTIDATEPDVETRK